MNRFVLLRSACRLRVLNQYSQTALPRHHYRVERLDGLMSPYQDKTLHCPARPVW